MNSEINRLEWRYRIEGGASTVFYYIGKDPRYIGKILRIKKPRIDGVNTILNQHNTFSKSQNDYTEKICNTILSLKDTGYISIPYQISINDVTEIFNSIYSIQNTLPRPVNRMMKHSLIIPSNPSDVIAYIMEDAMKPFDNGIGDVLSIEMKPKWPYEPGIDYNGWCITCLKHKISNSTISKYCSAYFFHSHKSHDSFYDAAMQLLQNSNYTRYFVNGERTEMSIFSKDKKLYSIFLDILFKSKIISNIKKAIQELDCKNIEEIYELYSDIITLKHKNYKEIESYMIFRALCDCSIIITLQKFDQSFKSIDENSGFVHRIRIVDLDKKPTEKINEYYRKYKEFLLKSKELDHGSCFFKCQGQFIFA